jgi:hypothetical protein
MMAWMAAMLLLVAEAAAILAVAMPARSSAAPVQPVAAINPADFVDAQAD